MYTPKCLIVWVDGEVKFHPLEDINSYFHRIADIPEWAYDCICIVTAANDSELGPQNSFGKYVKVTGSPSKIGWRHIPFEEFPPAFKAALCLLDIK